MMKEKGLKKLIVIEGMVEAEIIKSKLTAFDIPSVLKFEAVGRLLGITMDGLGKVNILVREEDLERALEVISPEEDNSTEE
ncbi:MAG: DUF2007 domain-containing protein [Candidatus Aminicenantes bacterium]|nr:DUF2007 domain-containing protein [Candidatus Aminicenantes bacterium]